MIVHASKAHELTISSVSGGREGSEESEGSGWEETAGGGRETARQKKRKQLDVEIGSTVGAVISASAYLKRAAGNNSCERYVKLRRPKASRGWGGLDGHDQRKRGGVREEKISVHQKKPNSWGGVG